MIELGANLKGDVVMAWQQVIGILGGLGPHAHLEFERRLLAGLGKVEGDQDYPDWLLASISSTPDRTRALVAGGPSPVDAMVGGLERLERGGAGFAAIACMTAHAFLPELRRRVALPILDMLALTVEHLVEHHGADAKIGLLATDGTLQNQLFQKASARLAPGISWLTPLDLPQGAALQERWVMRPIYGIKTTSEADPQTGLTHVEALETAAERLAVAGVDAVVCGCTEIGMALNGSDYSTIDLVDPLTVGAQATLERARKPALTHS